MTMINDHVTRANIKYDTQTPRARQKSPSMNAQIDDRCEQGRFIRGLARRCTKAALATLDAETGAPYTSLVTVALDHSGCPVLLLSELAWHTKNLICEARSSLLFDGTGGLNEPLEGPRASYMGQITRSERHQDARRFLAHHPDAVGYASFQDFSFYRMEPEQSHFVGGFGRITTLKAAEFMVNSAIAGQFEQAEPDIIEHMNNDHGDAVRLYAAALLGVTDGDWKMTGCDADGCDLMCGEHRARLEFPATLGAPSETRGVLAQLAKDARST